MVHQTEIILPPYGRGFHQITEIINKSLPSLPRTGIVNIFLQHTSAGLAINENFDRSVPADLSNAFNRLVPEGTHLYQHTDEGADDMPAHIKSAMVGVSLSIPILEYRLGLGRWQGIYLCEFRNEAHKRKIVITVIS
ncbi:MAG TPA: secondary thiamine-phosphate synthase enzyme YjbQ [Bacteroidales bacterium]|nr:secondary thiamine-phosphate synthase enzyme YjbQ [Bacteroidales bacterium]